MVLPETSNLLLPILKLLSDKGEYRLRQIVNSLAEDYKEDGDREFDDSAADAQFYSRVVGARSYLTHAKLINNPKRGTSVISERGLALLAEDPEDLTIKSLTRYPEFVDYLKSGLTEDVTALESKSEPENADSIESKMIINGNHVPHKTAPVIDISPFEDYTNDPTSSPQEPEPNVSQVHIPADYSTPHPHEVQMAQHATPLPQTGNNTPSGVSQRNTVVVSKESFTSTLELFEQLKVSSQLNQLAPATPIPVEEKTKGLSPALFALLSIMRFLENLFQNIWLYLIPFLLMMLAYGASFFILADEFASRGVLFVQHDTLIDQVSSIGQDNFSFFLSPSEQTAEQMIELLNTDAFIRLIIQQTPLEAKMAEGDKTVRETIEDTRDAINVGITGSNNVEVRATWDDREVAWKMANATLNSFIEWKINSDKRDSFAAREFLEQLVPQYENERLAAVQELEAYLVQHPEPFRGDRPVVNQGDRNLRPRRHPHLGSHRPDRADQIN